VASRAWRVAVPVVLALGGLLMATSAATARGTDLRSDRRTDLVDLVRGQAQQAERNDAQVQALRDDVDRLTAAAAAHDAPVGAARAEAARLSPLAGLTPMTGPAVTVTLDDAARDPGTPLPAGVSPDDVVVHQQDVQAVVNALWAGGAEGVTVMDQRLIATSAVRCVGNTLILHGRVYSPPFTISAVGDTAGMRAALEASPTLQIYRQWVEAVGLGYQVDEEPSRTLAAYAGPLDLPYATAAP
jgi:uncharacterized protein YlxW (UPF0749 family)